MKQPQIEYICDACKEPIANGDGVLWLDLDTIPEYKSKVVVWSRSGSRSRRPRPPRWSAHHSKCVRLPEHAHTVRVDSVRNPIRVHRTSEALIAALGNDLALTDWLDMLRYVAYGRAAAWFSGEPR